VKRAPSASGQALPFSLLRDSSFFMRCRNRPCRRQWARKQPDAADPFVTFVSMFVE